MATQENTLEEGQLKQEWNQSPELRKEFGDKFSAYAAFKRAEARGDIRIVTNSVSKGT